jgi:hypothetical protein
MGEMEILQIIKAESIDPERCMSDSETARKAGGSGRAFTSAVVIGLLGLLSLFAWRVFGG